MNLSLSSSQFASVLNKNKFKSSGLLFNFVFSKSTLVGFSINKSLGNSVSRNYFKRKCRALLFSKSFDYKIHLIVRPLVPLNRVGSLVDSFNSLYRFINHV